MKIRLGLLLALFVLFLAAPAQADTVLLSNSSSMVYCSYCGWDLNVQHWHGESFTFANTFSNVSITLPLSTFSAPYSGTAWLTTSLGPGTTASNIIATTTFNNINNSTRYVGPITFFSGLTLAPGSYFFVVSITSGGAMVEPLYEHYNFVVQTAPGVVGGHDLFALDASIYNCCSQNLAFPPGSDWYFNTGDHIPITITGNSAVPEPGTLLLLGSGLMGIWLRRRR